MNKQLIKIIAALLVAIASANSAESITPYILEEKYGKILYSERTSKINTVVIHAMSAINVNPEDPYSIEKCTEFLEITELARTML